ncbi:MAG: cytochrome c biogenesis protein [Bilophila sp.]
MLDMFSFEPALFLRGADGWLAFVGALLWGLGSALLSPCHLGIIPVLGSHAAGCGPFSLASPASPSRSHPVRQAMLFTFGVFLTVPLFGFCIALLGHGLELGGHFWTIPVGVLLLWFGWDMGQGHSCSHAGHVLETLRTRLGLTLSSGIFALGFGYGLLAGGCTVGFLVPLLVVALPGGVLYCVGLSACFGLGHCLPMIVVGCSAALARKVLQGHHTHDKSATSCDMREPHSGEALFRRILSVLIALIGLLFIVHPFME